MGEGDEQRIEVISDAESARSETELRAGGPRRRPWMAGVVLLAIAAWVAFAVSRDATEPEPAAPDPTTSTSAPASSTTTPERSGPAEPDGEFVAGEPASLLGEPSTHTLLLGSDRRGWRHVDLDMGYAVNVEALDGVAANAMLPVPGGVVVVEPPYTSSALVRLPHPVPGAPRPRREPLPLPPVPSDERHRIVGVLPASGDQLWVLTMPAGSREAPVTTWRVSLDGREVGASFETPSFPVGATSRGLVVEAGGRGYLVADDGVVDLGAGARHDARGTTVGRITCDDDLRCTLEAIDVVDGTRRTGPTFPTDAAGIAMATVAVADHGAVAAMPLRFEPDTSGGRSTTLHVVDASGWSATVPVDNASSAPVWLPGDQGVLVLTGLGVVRHHREGDELVSTPVHDLPAWSATDLFVIPPA